MNMDRSQKNLEKKKDDRTIEYLELKYDTNIQRGLTLAKVRQKQRGKRSSRNSITKEKKRIWFMCLKQEDLRTWETQTPQMALPDRRGLSL